MNPSYGTSGSYDPGEEQAAKAFIMHKRRRVNIMGIFLALFLPWLLYCAVFAARTFSIRYTSPSSSMLIVLGALCVVCVCFALAYHAWQRKRSGDPRYQPMWYIFLFLTTLLAVLLALVSGEANWALNMSQYFNMAHLNDYGYVDPARMRGQQMMDAGRVGFVNSTFLDLRLSMGFRNDEVYCVAPITSTSSPLASYDFWAVGLNCCSGSTADFHCGEYNNPRAHGGLRLMKDNQRAYFRLAVQQAEAAYGIQAEHPLFFRWTSDPDGEQGAYMAVGVKAFFLGVWGHFFLQAVFVSLALYLFSKVGAP